MNRDYVHERQIEDPARKKQRAERNAARRTLEKEVGKAALKGREVDHKNGRTGDNRRGNLRAVSPTANNNGRRGGPATVKGK